MAKNLTDNLTGYSPGAERLQGFQEGWQAAIERLPAVFDIFLALAVIGFLALIGSYIGRQAGFKYWQEIELYGYMTLAAGLLSLAAVAWGGWI